MYEFSTLESIDILSEFRMSLLYLDGASDDDTIPSNRLRLSILS